MQFTLRVKSKRLNFLWKKYLIILVVNGQLRVGKTLQPRVERLNNV